MKTLNKYSINEYILKFRFILIILNIMLDVVGILHKTTDFY